MHTFTSSMVCAVVFATAAVSGCARFDIPEGTPVSCSGDTDCPTDYACRIDRCLPVDSESVPPALDATTTISPALAGVGDTVTVSLVANEPLASTPQLSLVTASGRRAFDVTLDDAGLNASANLTVLANDANGAAQIVATLVDRAGNQASDVLVGTVVLDTTAPQSVTVEANRTTINDDDDATVVITASEPLGATSTVSIDGAFVETSVEGNELFATIVIDPAVAEGGLLAHVQLIDLAGNSSDVDVDTHVAVDRTAPTLSLVGRTTLAGRGGVLSLTVSADEPLAAPPAAVRSRDDGTGSDIDVEVTDTGGGVYRLLSRVTDADADGRWSVSVGFGRDLAGNVCDELVVTDFVIDTTPPAFSTPPVVENEAISRQPNHDATVLTFAVAEPASATVSLADGTELPCTDVDQMNYTCSVTAEDIANDGAVVVFVEVSDAVGNRAFSSVGLVVDTVAPTLLANAVQLLPPAGALIDDVSALTAGAAVRVSFTIDDAEASVAARVAPDVLDFTTVQPDGGVPSFVASAVAPADIANGTIALSLLLTDALGNSVTANLGGVRIDTTAPTAPPVDDVDAVVYSRTPWGSTATAGVPQFQIALSALNAGDTVFAWAQGTTTTAPLARGTVGSDGGVVLDLGGNDRAEVFVNVVDNAGNASPVVRVRDIAWTATLGRKVAGSTLENPHGFVQLGNTQDRLVVASANENGGAQTVRADGVVTTTTAAIRFQKAGGLETPNTPNPLATFDSARGRVVVLTGEDEQPQTWEHDGQQWQQIVPADPEGDGNSANRQGGGGLVYHAARDVSVLFGGLLNPGLPDTWTWNGTSWALAEQCTSNCPPPLTQPAMAYDELASEVVMFGGTNRSFSFDAPPGDATFVWDGTWTAVCTGSCPRPPARQGAMMAWDEARSVMVLFGGRDGSVSFNDVWEWDGVTWREVDVTDEEGDGNPAARSLGGFAFDKRRGELVLIGGTAGALPSSRVFDDVWSFDGRRFQRLNVDDAPALRAPAAVSTTTGLQVVGGSISPEGRACGPGACGGPWVLEGNRLVDGGLTTGPAPRARPAMTFDRARGQAVMFGGSPTESQAPVRAIVDDVLWLWNGQRWEGRAPEVRPAAREFTALAWDADREVVVLFGGTGVDTCDGVDDGISFAAARVFCPSVVWEWDGATWTKQTPAGDVPDPRQGHSMVYDEIRQRVLLFGGQTESQTQLAATQTCDGLQEVACSTLWEWDGRSWRRVVPLDDEGDGNPPGRGVFVFAFDRKHGETVLVSGDTGLFTLEQNLNPTNNPRLTWTWNGERWRLASNVALFTTFLGGASYYDPQRERVVVFGGKGPGDATAAVIEWDGEREAWTTPRTVVDPEGDAQPVARQTPAAAFDEVNNVAIIFGGLLADPFTWLLHSSQGHSVAHQFDFTFAAAGAPRDVTFIAVDVDVATAAAAPAASLLVWDNGWRPLVNAPAGVNRISDDDGEVQRWLANSSATLHLALRSPTGAAQLSTDAVAATIRYRLPTQP